MCIRYSLVIDCTGIRMRMNALSHGLLVTLFGLLVQNEWKTNLPNTLIFMYNIDKSISSELTNVRYIAL